MKKKLVKKEALDDGDSISVKECDCLKKVVVVQVLSFNMSVFFSGQ